MSAAQSDALARALAEAVGLDTTHGARFRPGVRGWVLDGGNPPAHHVGPCGCCQRRFVESMTEEERRMHAVQPMWVEVPGLAGLDRDEALMRCHEVAS